MSASDTLTAELRTEVLHLEDDLRARVTSEPDLEAAWRAEYDDARASERTSATWEAWVDERVTLAAVAWNLTTVFIRFCEDNGLVKPVWITHSGGRHREALDAQQQFLREAARTNPDVTDREWLLEAVAHLSKLPATAGLVDGTSPMWLVQPSGDAATRLLSYWRERDDDGALLRDLTDPELDTRFLGDLYQDVSEEAKKRYALLQTPVFVEEFILDRTLEPALNERPLEGFKAIDPTCGSGHFLLGIFQRLLDRWHKKAPNMDERERVQAALDAVHGVDLNPFAVSIARFRLTVAALQACGMTSLEDAPAFKYHLAAGDSLLHGLDQGEFDLGAGVSADRVAAEFAYATENLDELQDILRNAQYDCVVGNPPYIQAKDKALNAAYRQRYATCKGKYALTVPFMERFFQLAKGGERSGWTGQITSNSFMKREFGSTLIEKYLPKKDVRLIVDTSGVYIPGHGTPTVVVVGRSASPSSGTVRVVLGNRGSGTETSRPESAPGWISISENVDTPGHSDDWVSVVDLDRTDLAKHPWSLSGGGASEALQAIETAAHVRLGSLADLGMTDLTGEDEVFLRSAAIRRERESEWVRPIVEGDNVRDYMISVESVAILPVSLGGEPLTLPEGLMRHLWPYRVNLSNRLYFGKKPHERGLRWFDHAIFFPKRHRTRLALAFPFVSTHNHFVIDRTGTLFKQTAPIVKLVGEDEAEYRGLLATLNSSVALFWMRSQCLPKPLSGEEWERRYEFDTSKMKRLPLPAILPDALGAELDSLAEELVQSSPVALRESATITNHSLREARTKHLSARAQLISLQEELDWEAYRLYDLTDEDLTYSESDLPELSLGERAFEIVLARNLKSGVEETAWFERHGSNPITEIPGHWPAAYRDLVQKRIELIESNQFIKLMEKPEYKRRWVSESWEKQEERALRGWLLDRLEDERFWFDSHGRPTPHSVATLADEVSRDDDMVSVLALWEGRPDVPVAKSLESLLAKEAVPYLAAYRYKEPGLRKRADWESTWELQRREDAGTYNPAPKDQGGDGPIPVPPKYKSSDFRKTEYWSHRGKLDVPKERFLLYPDAGRETDPTPVLGWAGWDHAEQALAIATLIQQRESDGWEDERLVPLVAGLAEVLPWVKQWHDEPDDRFGGANLAEFMAEQLEERMTQVEATAESLKAWRPAPARRGRKAKA